MLRHWALVACVGLAALGHESAPAVVSVSPSSGSGAGRTFTFIYADPDGGPDIAMTEVAIVSGTELTGRHACNFYAGADRIWLRDDDDRAWIGPVTAGAPASLRNSQCAVAAASFALLPSGDRLTMTVTVTFAAAFAGAKTIFTKVTDAAGQATEWVAAGTWTAAALNPAPEVVTSSCPDPSSDPIYSVVDIPEQNGRSMRRIVTPACYPVHSHYMAFEGMFLDDRRPLPVMGRTAGHFEVIFVFVDTEANRQKLLDNAAVPASVKAEVAAGRVREALTDLLVTYTPAAVMAGVRREAAGVAEFSYAVALANAGHAFLELNDPGLGFAGYDAVVFLDDLGAASGIGVRRWPWQRHLFHGRDGGYFLNLDPRALTPALFGHELLGRNLPVLLSEYLVGERAIVVEGGVTYDRTPIINPRTGENLEPLVRAYEGKTPIANYIAGYTDVDGDGMVDAIDPEITPTADNVDGDFIPDRFDPDLRVNHRPFSWLYAERGGRAP